MRMIDSKQRREMIEGLWLLVGFVNTKGCLPYYGIIIQGLAKLIDMVDSDVFGLVWKIIVAFMPYAFFVNQPILVKCTRGIPYCLGSSGFEPCMSYGSISWTFRF